MVQAVSDFAANAEENIAHAAKVISHSPHRRLVFIAIYTGKRRAKKVSALMESTGLSRIRVLDAGKKLVDDRVVKSTKLDGETAYEKLHELRGYKQKILRLAASPTKLRAFPTKRNPAGLKHLIQVRYSGQRPKVRVVTIDDIDSFRQVRSVRRSVPEIGDALSETQFKNGLQRILGQRGQFKDWGGEIADLYTSRMRIKGCRYRTALALKGPAAKGRLTPGKMGKNGDQIQRLFAAPAEVFLVQYCRQVDPAIPTLMELLATATSIRTGKTIFHGIVDGQDSKRLLLAYPKAFRAAPQRGKKKA
jgi:hypothetical protein